MKKKTKKVLAPVDWLQDVTGKCNSDWVALVQDTIRKLSRPTKDPWHSSNDSAKVIAKLAAEIKKTWPKEGRFDGNMRLTSTLGFVLCLWYLRIHRAKSYDPRRPVAHRRAAYYQRQAFCRALFLAMLDESKDAEMFPGQRWETPFDPYPTDGYFV